MYMYQRAAVPVESMGAVLSSVAQSSSQFKANKERNLNNGEWLQNRTDCVSGWEILNTYMMLPNGNRDTEIEQLGGDLTQSGAL